MNDDLHLRDHDQCRATGIDRTPLLQEIPCGRKGIEDQNRPIKNAEVVDVTFDQDNISAGDTARQTIDD